MAVSPHFPKCHGECTRGHVSRIYSELVSERHPPGKGRRPGAKVSLSQVGTGGGAVREEGRLTEPGISVRNHLARAQ